MNFKSKQKGQVNMSRFTCKYTVTGKHKPVVARPFVAYAPEVVTGKHRPVVVRPFVAHAPEVVTGKHMLVVARPFLVHS
jgi:hypothetical protein